MLEMSTQGRRWLPADTETAESHFERLADFHRHCANAFYLGAAHVAKEKAKEQSALLAAQRVRELSLMNPANEKTEGAKHPSAEKPALSEEDIGRIAEAVCKLAAERALKFYKFALIGALAFACIIGFLRKLGWNFL